MPAPSLASLIDVVDEQNQPIGVVRRRDVFRLRANFRTVHVLVVNSHDELLLQRLTWTRDGEPGRWGTSAAGYLHAGEAYLAAARRRVTEELGLSAPLAEVGVTCLHDEGAAQFLGVYSGVAPHPCRPAPSRLVEVAFLSLDAVEHDLAAHPDDYTETFRHVLAFWRQVPHPATLHEDSLREPVSAP
jgi:isopentenyl-diphosphate delta-isomerase